MTIIQRTPWRRILLEGAVIVVSILLAFSIDAWWENRTEQQREREHLISMREEFQDSLSGVNEVLTSIQSHAHNVDSLIAMLKAAGDQPVLVPGPLLGSAITWRTSDVSISTLEALIASGDLNVLRNVDLRAELAGLPAFLQDVTEDEIVAQMFAETEMATFLAREGLAEIAYAHRAGVQDDTGIAGLSAPSEISVVSNPELIGYLTARRVHFWYSEEGLPNVMAHLEMIIEQIDNELGSE